MNLSRVLKQVVLTGFVLCGWSGADAAVLWSDPTSRLINDASFTLAGTPTRGSSATDTLYFRFRVDPTSDWTTENYFAAFQFYESGNERLGVGNAFSAFAYSAFNTASGNVDLNSANPESGQTFQVVRNTDLTTIVFKIKFNSSADDNVTVWLNPTAGSEASQASARTTTFNANATFDQIRLREGNFPNGGGWTFDSLAIAEGFNDIVPVPEPTHVALGFFGALLAGNAVWRLLKKPKRTSPCS